MNEGGDKMSEYPTKKIKEVMDLIDSGEWVLPTFQRKYVWDQDQICDLRRTPKSRVEKSVI